MGVIQITTHRNKIDQSRDDLISRLVTLLNEAFRIFQLVQMEMFYRVQAYQLQSTYTLL